VSPVLTRDQILAARDIKIEFVKIPEWSSGDPETGVYVRGLTGVARDAFEYAMIDQKRGLKGQRPQQEVNLRNLRAKLIVRCAVDSEDPETAKTIFKLEDVEALGRKSGAALQRVYEVAQRLSGLSNEDVEELTVELGEDQSDGSGSSSPLLSDTDPSPSVNAGSPVESLLSGLPTIGSSPSEMPD